MRRNSPPTQFLKLAAVLAGGMVLGDARAELIGAKAVLARAAADAAEGAPAGENFTRRIRADLEALPAETDPGKWAERWVALADQVAAEPSMLREDDALSFENLAVALPPPAGWPTLRAATPVGKNSDPAPELERTCLAWYASRLLGDEKGLVADYRRMGRLSGELQKRNPGRSQPPGIDNLADATIAIMTDRAEIAALLDERLREAIAGAAALVNEGYGNRADFSVPDVAMLLEPAAAEKWLGEALTTYPGDLRSSGSPATTQLLGKLAGRLAERLAAPQWALTCSLDGGPLYAALRKRFGGSMKQFDFREAQAFAFYRALIADDRASLTELLKASAEGRMNGNDFLRSGSIPPGMAEGPRAALVSRGLHRILAADPAVPLWRPYIRAAVLAGDSPEMLALIDKTLASPALPAALREELRDARLSADLAADQTEAAAKLLREAAASSGSDRPDEGFSAAVELARLGMLVGNPAWAAEGRAAAVSHFEEQAASPRSFYRMISEANDLSDILLDDGRAAEVEKIWMKVLTVLNRDRQKRDENSDFDREDGRGALRALTGIYTAAGRSADVLTLLDTAPQWGAADLATIFSEECALGDRKSWPLGVCVAWALVQEGQRDKAVALLEAMLPQLIGKDSAYDLLTGLLGIGALPALDRVAKLDAFEERPLIWKAKVLFDAGKFDEAEAVARAAVKIDPSDGEQGPGDRMRVYAILAEIMAAKGDSKQADFLRGVVKSIRLSEKADAFASAGLLKRAIALYDESLGFFADAYCIQSRLARRLAEAGDWAGAEAHYRRAYELMPDSFGRVESHCFGCEHAFAGEKQQTIAEQIFTRLAAEHPENPQVHYLLGYLHDEQDRPRDAVREYQKAVALDPDYLNAWKKLAAAPAAALPPTDHTRVAENLIRLDPAGRHHSFDLTGVGDLAKIWRQLEAVQRDIPGPPTALHALPASAAADAADPRARRDERDLEEAEDRLPGRVFAQQSFSRAAGAWMEILADGYVD